MQLPELHPGEGPADVLIRYRTVDDPPARQEGFEAHGNQVTFDVLNIRFVLTGGQTIDIEAPSGIEVVDVRIFLLGSVMAAFLNQREYLTIHANLVRAGDGAAAFAGHSGAGKSTLASWFDERGHHVMSDDLCAVRFDDGMPLVFDGIPRMKLWEATLSAFGRSSEGLEKVASDMEKFHVPLRSAGRTGSLTPVPLHRVYVLERASPGEETSIEPLAGIQAAQALLANAFRWGIGQAVMESPRAQFDQCLAVAKCAAVFRVRRRWAMDGFDEAAKAIERHLQTPLD